VRNGEERKKKNSSLFGIKEGAYSSSTYTSRHLNLQHKLINKNWIAMFFDDLIF
jgi:hypothetical protein